MPFPRARALAAVLALIGTLLSVDPILLCLGWIFLLTPTVVASRLVKVHAKFIFGLIAPMALALFVIWGYLVAAPPGAEIGSDPLGGLRFAALVASRLVMLGGIAQVAVLSIAPQQLPYTLYCWGLRGQALVIVLGAFSLIPEMAIRTDQVLTARLARGLMPDRRLMTRLRQLPFLLRPLFAGILQSAVLRSEGWHQRQTFLHVEDFASEGEAGSPAISILYIGLGSAWLGLNLATRLIPTWMPWS